MDLTIRLAAAADLDAIWALVVRAKAVMRTEGSEQWNDNYPRECDFSDDIVARELWCVCDAAGTILGVAALNMHEDPAYLDVPWSVRGPAFCLHRMAVDPAAQRQGVARALLQQLEDLAWKNGVTTLRTDTYCQNEKMRSLFQKVGFSPCAELTLHDLTEPFIAFEKVL